MYINTVTSAYPLSERDIREVFPNTSFASPFTAPEDYTFVFPTPQPDYNAVTHWAQEGAPVLTNKGTWAQTWTTVKRYALQADEDAAVAADTALKVQTLQASIVTATQLRLDSFAQTRNYDNILSACTYASSSVPRFQAEGQTCVNQRDATWAKLYEIMAEVQAGTRPMPTGYTDIESELPVLVWP